MKKQLCNLHCGNKGFIFSLDVAIAIFVVVAILAASTFYVTRANEDNILTIQFVRTGSDILSLLDYSGTLKGLSKSSIQVELNKILPTNYNARLEITGETLEGPLIIETSTFSPQNEFIIPTERIFMKDYKFYKAKIYLWLK